MKLLYCFFKLLSAYLICNPGLIKGERERIPVIVVHVHNPSTLEAEDWCDFKISCAEIFVCA